MKRKHFRIHPTVCFLYGCLFVLLAGCRKPETDIGLGLQPDSELLDVVFTDTATVELATFIEDSLRTSRLSTGLVGHVFVPDFCQLNASVATQLRLSATDVNFGPNAVADSMFLQLHYTGDHYGRLTPMAFSVQPLADSLSVSEDLYSNAVVTTTGDEWVSWSAGPLELRPQSDVVLTEDTLPPTLRIPLRLDVAQTILDLDTTTFDNNAAWFEHLQGLLIQRSETGGGVVAFDTNSGLSVMRIHYHNDNDTSAYDFLISPLSARVNLFQHEYVGALDVVAGNPDAEFISGDDNAYVMSASGSKVRLRFPHLESFVDSAGVVPTVLRAQLVVPVDGSFFDKPIPAQEQLFVQVNRADGTLVPTPDDEPTSPVPVGGAYDSQLDAYVFNLTSTVQGLIKGEFDDGDLYIVSNRSGVSVASAVLRGTEVDNPAKLNLTLGL